MKKFIIVIVSILTLVTVLAGYLFVKQAAEDRRQAAERMALVEADVREIIDQLKVPPEAIHLDYGALREIVRLRRQGFQKYGLQEHYPYAQESRREMIQDAPPNSAFSVFDQGLSFPATTPSRKASGWVDANQYDEGRSPEWFWIARAAAACDKIAWSFHNSHSELGVYLTQHMEMYEKEIRPRLLLLAEGRSDHYAIGACEALAVAGERTQFLQQRLTAMAMDSSGYTKGDTADNAGRLLKRCGFPAPSPWPTMESLSAYKDDTGAKTDGLGDPLPAGAILRVGQARLRQELHAAPPLQECPNILEGDCDGRTLYLTRKANSRQQGLYIDRLDVGTGEMTRVVLAGPDEVRTAAVSDDGTVLATYGICGTEPPVVAGRRARDVYRLMLWNLQTGQPIGDITPAYSIQWLRFTPHHERLIAGDNTGPGYMSIYDVSQRQLICRLPGYLLRPPMFAPNPDYAASQKDSGLFMLGLEAWYGSRMKVWSESTGMRPVDFNPLVEVSAAAQSHNGKWTATFSSGSNDSHGLPRGILRIWEQTGRNQPTLWTKVYEPRLVSMHKLQLSSPKDNYWGIFTAAYSPGDEFLLTTHSGNSSIIVWDLEGRPRGRIAGHAGEVKQIRFIGDKFISASDDATLLVWDWLKIADWCRRQVKTDKADTQPATQATANR